MAVPGVAPGLGSRRPLHHLGTVVLSLRIHRKTDFSNIAAVNVFIHTGVSVCGDIQVEALADDEVVEGPVHVTINVLDVNNNAPFFNQSVYTAVVRENNPAGVYYA